MTERLNTTIFSRSFYVAANGIASFFLWQGNIPLHVCVCIYIYIHTHHIFFMHFSVSGHFISFQVLAPVNSAAMNTVTF